MRRTHLRGHHNILKRLLVYAKGFNLGLIMRRLIGYGIHEVGTARMGADMARREVSRAASAPASALSRRSSA